ncbi:MAG: hypothetical protein E7436_05615 [Ruminococcaceae bacterium]|nr:hypothetical protein [Oscillospiraceae bacterium]
MNRKIWPFHLAYYILYLLVYIGCLFFVHVTYDAISYTLGWDSSMLVRIWVLPLTTPIYMIIATRFSLWKMYLDPIAAFLTALGYYCYQIFSLTGVDFMTRFTRINASLSLNSGRGWWILVFLFVLGLFLSFSAARKDGKNISCRLLAKLDK